MNIQDLTGDQKEKINDLLTEWNRIQGRLKEAEQISQEAVIAAVNELRYAGRLLVGALAGTPSSVDGTPMSIDETIVSARQYLTNADNDISDALLYFLQKRVDEINFRYGAKSVSEYFPEYNEILSDLERTRTLVIESRINLSLRPENYKEITELLEGLIKLYFTLDKAQVFMGLEIQTYHKKIYFWKFVSLASILTAIGIYIMFN